MAKAAGAPNDDDDTDDEKTYTASQVQKAIDAQIKKLQKDADKEAAKLRTQLQELMDGKTLTDDERGALQDQLDAAKSGETRLREELERIKTQSTHKLTETEKRAQAAESELTETLISRALIDAAMGKAAGKDPSANAKLIAQILRAEAKLDPTTKAVGIEREVLEDGAKVKKVLTPTQAVEYMETKQVDQYGSLFKSTASGGGGGNNNLPTGPVDVSKLTMDQYAALRKTKTVDQILSGGEAK